MPFAAWTWPELVNTIVQSLAALGTFLAVWVALHIANQDRRIILLPRVDLATRYDGDVVRITVTNIQRRTARFTTVYWKVGIFKRGLFYLSVADPLRGSSGLEIELHDGEQAQYDIAVIGRKGNSPYAEGPVYSFNQILIQRLIGCYPRVSRGILRKLWLRWMKVGVETTTGKKFEHRIDRRLRQWLSKELHSS